MTTIETEQQQAVAAAPILQITEAAIKQVRRQRARTGNEGKYLRLGVKGGGCSGLSYVIAFEDADEADPEFDHVWTVEDDVTVAVDPKSAKYLRGATLDYSIKNLMEGGFVFHNPNAEKSCGCGTSFTAR